MSIPPALITAYSYENEIEVCTQAVSAFGRLDSSMQLGQESCYKLYHATESLISRHADSRLEIELSMALMDSYPSSEASGYEKLLSMKFQSCVGQLPFYCIHMVKGKELENVREQFSDLFGDPEFKSEKEGISSMLNFLQGKKYVVFSTVQK